MSGRIIESIDARVDVRLTSRRARRSRPAETSETAKSDAGRENADVIFNGQGRNAGLEVMGNLTEEVETKAEVEQAPRP
jgi:hypothetical protein